MASLANSTVASRRSILGGAFALTAVMAVAAPAISAPLPSHASSVAWDALFAEWKRAETLYHNNTDAAADHVLSETDNRLWKRLMKMPAPHSAALLWKMDYLWGEDQQDGMSDAWSMEIVDPVLRDARRLLG